MKARAKAPTPSKGSTLGSGTKLPLAIVGIAVADKTKNEINLFIEIAFCGCFLHIDTVVNM